MQCRKHKKPRKQSERLLQIACVRHAHILFPQIRGLLFHPANGGKRNIIEATKFKAMGVVAGVPDLLLLWQGKLYAFELKSTSGHISQNQEIIQKKWQEHGVETIIVKDVASFIDMLEKIIKNPNKIFSNSCRGSTTTSLF